MTAILGISALYHDAAAALVVDGRIVAAAQEERFTREKHDERPPEHAIAYCLAEAGLTAGQIDHVAFYDKPLLKFERLLETYLAIAPRGFGSFVQAMPAWLRGKLFTGRLVRRAVGREYKRRLIYAEHHESHAASAFFPSPFDEAAVLTLDGVGEWATASLGAGRGNRVELVEELRFPHSLGLLYSAFTYYCGFKVNSGEYKLMGLAPYGEPAYAGLIRDRLIDLKADGSFRMDMDYFNYLGGLTMTSARFHRLFGGPPRRPEAPIEGRHMDLAASIQVVTEEVMLRAARHAHDRTGLDHLCLAGGVALNCVGNGRILREGPFREVWVQPAAGDAGGALGAALFVWHQLLGKPRVAARPDAQSGSLLGPGFDDGAIRAALDRRGAAYREYGDDASMCEAVAALLADGQVVGWFQGRMEFGPRALGARSILGDPRRADMQTVMNVKIKFRESFRPFAPAVLADRAAEAFDLPGGHESPYMLLVAPVVGGAVASRSHGFARLSEPRGDLPAVTHVDGSARIQTVDAERSPLFHRLLSAFDRRTECPVLVNTSFNVRGEPIVHTPDDAYRCFRATAMDALAIGRFVLVRDDQPEFPRHAVDAYLAAHRPD